MSKEPNDATDTEREINGVKYVGKTAPPTKDWRGFSVPSCDGCVGKKNKALCFSLPLCRSTSCRLTSRTDGLNLIFVPETKEKANV